MVDATETQPNEAEPREAASRVAAHGPEAMLNGLDTMDSLIPYSDNYSWYQEDRPNVSDSTQELLQKYSKIPADQVVEHCMKTRDEAWEIFPYPCIGQYRFLDLSVGMSFAYPEVLERMRSGSQTYLDLGCCFAQDVRRLVYDGVPSEMCYGSDLRLDFMELGYKLFLDKDTLKSKFIAADIFNPDSDLKQLDGRVDIIHAASFFHLFDRDEQMQIGKRCVELLKPRKDSLILGRQVGNKQGGRFPHRTRGGYMFRHDLDTWSQMWAEIGEATGTKWDVQATLKEWKFGTRENRQAQSYQHEGAQRLEFSIRRLA